MLRFKFGPVSDPIETFFLQTDFATIGEGEEDGPKSFVQKYRNMAKSKKFIHIKRRANWDTYKRQSFAYTHINFITGCRVYLYDFVLLGY